jgi:hypothetical protein
MADPPRPGADGSGSPGEASGPEELLVTEANFAKVEALLEPCKELSLTIVFLGGSTQLKDSSCLARWVAARVATGQPAGAPW